MLLRGATVEAPAAAALGLYLSVPFCRSKCSFCNFASGVYPESRLPAYVARLVEDLERARTDAHAAGLCLPEAADSIYLGGGTPSLLSPALIAQLFAAIHRNFHVAADAEITIEAAPGQLDGDTLPAAIDNGIHRFSFGVQSFVDSEAAAVGRLHTRSTALADIARVCGTGAQVSVDLICGLPGQTAESLITSLAALIGSGVNHASIYMLEVDEDSRLGREMLLGGVRYGAPSAPSDDATVEMYLEACEQLERAGIRQYEISNFARPGSESRHNLKYWQRRPYLGVGLDAGSMLRDREGRAVRFSTTDSLDAYLLAREESELHRLDQRTEHEEAWFLGLRTNAGVDLGALEVEFGAKAVAVYMPVIEEFCVDHLLTREGNRITLTPRGRMISNEVFEGLLELQAMPAICLSSG